VRSVQQELHVFIILACTAQACASAIQEVCCGNLIGTDAVRNRLPCGIEKPPKTPCFAIDFIAESLRKANTWRQQQTEQYHFCNMIFTVIGG
ncbi:MAG: hypothetical protein WBD31_11930, partial [Rubripirellula sp.]